VIYEKLVIKWYQINTAWNMKRYRRIGEKLDAKLVEAEKRVVCSENTLHYSIEVKYRNALLDMLGPRNSFTDPYPLPKS